MKKGSRLIVVDDVTYRWRVRGKPTYCQGLGWSPLTYAVELAANPGTMLVIKTSRPHLSNWLSLPSKPILPAEVATSIRTARSRGWAPDDTGTPFILDLPELEEIGLFLLDASHPAITRPPAPLTPTGTRKSPFA
jgi:hypothetical protein